MPQYGRDRDKGIAVCETRSHSTRICDIAHMSTMHIVYIAYVCRRHHTDTWYSDSAQLCPAYSRHGPCGSTTDNAGHATHHTMRTRSYRTRPHMPIDRARYRRMAVIGHPCHESPSTRGLTTPTSVIYAGHINHNREEHIMQKSIYDQIIDTLEARARDLGWDHGLDNPHDHAPLSGEWADSMTPSDLYRKLGFKPDEWPDWVSEHLCNTFEEHAEQARAVSAMDD